MKQRQFLPQISASSGNAFASYEETLQSIRLFIHIKDRLVKHFTQALTTS